MNPDKKSTKPVPGPGVFNGQTSRSVSVVYPRRTLRGFMKATGQYPFSSRHTFLFAGLDHSRLHVRCRDGRPGYGW